MGVYYIYLIFNHLKINAMRKNQITFLLIVFFVVGIMSCKKDITQTEQNALTEKNVSDLKNWYSSQMNNENLVSQNSSLLKLASKPDWNNTMSFENGTTFITPLINTGLKHTHAFFLTKMTQAGEVKTSKLEILITPDNQPITSFDKLSLLNIMQLKGISTLFSGTTLEYDLNSKEISRKKIEKGEILNIKPERLKLTSKKIEKDNAVARNSIDNNVGENGYWLTTYFIVYDTNTGQIYSVTYLYSTWVGGSGNGNETPTTDDGPGGGGGSDPCAVATQSAQDDFDNYITMTPGQTSYDCPSSLVDTYNTGAITWTGVNGGGGWHIKVNATYGYYRYNFITIYNQSVPTYNFVNFSSGNGFYQGSNNIVTSTYTTTHPTLNQIFYNNSENAYGRSQIFGTIRHVSNISIPIPFCGDLTLDQTLDVSPSVSILPK